MALRIYPNDPLALAQHASIRTQQAGEQLAPADSEAQALESLRKLGLNPRALRVVAIVRAGRGDGRGALRVLGVGEDVTRRDFLTQLMLIEAAVERGDVATALKHYNRALRTSPDAGPVLFPTLAAASQDPGIRAPLLALISGNPPWLPQFIDWITHYSTDPGALLPILQHVSPTWSALDPEHQRLLGARLVKERNYARARMLYRHLRHVTPSSTGRLVFATGLPPLDWELETGGDRSATANRDTGKLDYYVDGNSQGPIGRRLLTLSPGRYAVVTTGTSDLDEPMRWPVWSVRCTQTDAQLARITAVGQATTVLFEVPSGCPDQWLSLATSGPADRSQSGQIDPVLIRPVDGSAMPRRVSTKS